MRRRATIIALSGWISMATPALAQDDAKDQSGGTIRLSGPRATRATAPEYHREGEYGGVTPEVIYRYHFELAKKETKRVERWVQARKNKQAKRPLTITWVGFQPRGGGASRVFFQLNREAEYTQEVRDGKLVVTIYGARYRTRNTRRQIITRHFDSAISSITTRRVRKRRARKGKPARRAALVFTLHFKNPADAAQASAKLGLSAKDGYWYLTLDIGPASAAPAKSGSS